MDQQLESLEDKIEAVRKAVVDMNKVMMESFKIADKNFAAIEAKINTIDEKIDTLARNSSKEFATVGGKIDQLKTEVIKIQKVSNYPEHYENMLKISK